jgi:hypothetical protein
MSGIETDSLLAQAPHLSGSAAVRFESQTRLATTAASRRLRRVAGGQRVAVMGQVPGGEGIRFRSVGANPPDR